MTTVPPSKGPRPSLISALVLTDRDNAPPAAAQALLADDQDRRMVLVELRLPPGTDPESVRDRFRELFDRVYRTGDAPPPPVPVGRHYMRCVLTPDEVERLVQGGARSPTAKSAARALELIYHVWPDLVVEAHLDRSLTTIKADAASRTYSCSGAGVVWGVLDSGIDENHPHFAANATLCADSVKALHRDFTIRSSPGSAPAPLSDAVGHGTHVAGVIAGCGPAEPNLLRIACNEPTTQGLPQWAQRTLPAGGCLSGVAPKANLVSLKVLDDNGKTLSSVIIDALDYVRTVNGYGRDLQIHGVNLSLGCGWLPRDYAAGQSPLCRELDLLVGTGVIAVVSAGNSGAGGAVTGMSSDVYGQLSTITDPGNAATAITVGSVHRYRPHTYGITFDSSKGPTLDGRPKPDLVAPGERITSAATGQLAQGVPPLAPGRGDPPNVARYIEDSGTSMAAAHVSGVIAAFLSARTEYIGQPQLVKKLFMDTATDLGRHLFFQGAGLVDLMRALSAT
jgi:subtilisin family serine protease